MQMGKKKRDRPPDACSAESALDVLTACSFRIFVISSSTYAQSDYAIIACMELPARRSGGGVCKQKPERIAGAAAALRAVAKAKSAEMDLGRVADRGSARRNGAPAGRWAIHASGPSVDIFAVLCAPAQVAAAGPAFV